MRHGQAGLVAVLSSVTPILILPLLWLIYRRRPAVGAWSGAVLLPLFMTTMLGVPAWLAGLVVLLPKLWLIVCDPLVGAWSDRMKTLRSGKGSGVIGRPIATLTAAASWPRLLWS